VAVSDQGAVAVPRLEAHDPGSASGRGLQLVAALALAWGVERGPQPPTTVWFTLFTG